MSNSLLPREHRSTACHGAGTWHLVLFDSVVAVVILMHRIDEADVRPPQAPPMSSHLWVFKPDLFDHGYVATVTLQAAGAKGHAGV